jgi:endo-1,4-beta-xylanase
MRTMVVCFSLFFSGLALAADRPEIPLWANGAPGSEGKTAREVDEPPNKDHGYLKVTGVHNPSLTVFLPPRETATGAAMVIAPGGGHQFLNFDQEGTYVAEYLNSIGVAGFVLKYRLAREPGSTYKVDDAVADAERAIRVIRSRAEEWHVNPGRVGMMGFSAGGEVAALASTRFDAGKTESADPIERQSSRPDFDALIYPGIRAENYTNWVSP